jgi:periplasmic divalent cation tolerance protein
MTEYCVIMVTFPSRADAEKTARILLDRHLVACTNLIDGVGSLFWWEGKIDSAREVLMIAKTTQTLFSDVASCVQEHHPYEVPEVIALPILAGSQSYLSWIDESVKG